MKKKYPLITFQSVLNEVYEQNRLSYTETLKNIQHCVKQNPNQIYITEEYTIMSDLGLNPSDEYHISMVTAVFILVYKNRSTPDSASEMLVNTLTSCEVAANRYKHQLLIAMTALLKNNQLDQVTSKALVTAANIIKMNMNNKPITMNVEHKNNDDMLETTIEKTTADIIAIPGFLVRYLSQISNNPEIISAKFHKSFDYQGYCNYDKRDITGYYYWRIVIVPKLHKQESDESKLEPISYDKLRNYIYRYALSCKKDKIEKIIQDFYHFKRNKKLAFIICFTINKEMYNGQNQGNFPQIIFSSKTKYPSMHDWQLLIVWLQSLANKKLAGPSVDFRDVNRTSSKLKYNLNISIIDHHGNYIVELGKLVGAQSSSPCYPHSTLEYKQNLIKTLKVQFSQFSQLYFMYKEICEQETQKPKKLHLSVKGLFDFMTVCLNQFGDHEEKNSENRNRQDDMNLEKLIDKNPTEFAKKAKINHKVIRDMRIFITSHQTEKQVISNSLQNKS